MESTPKKLAYCVADDFDGRHVITFATSGAAARRIGGAELGLEFGEVAWCKRAPWADEYASQDYIPAEAYIANGWWMSCDHCGIDLYDGVEEEGDELKDDEAPAMLQLVYAGRSIYCSQSCRDAKKKEIADRQADFEDFQQRVRDKYPDLTFTELQGGWPWRACSAKFSFPGSKYGGSIRREEGGKLMLFVAQGDIDAWMAYEASREQAQADEKLTKEGG